MSEFDLELPLVDLLNTFPTHDPACYILELEETIPNVDSFDLGASEYRNDVNCGSR